MGGSRLSGRPRLDERLWEVADVVGANLATRPVYVIRASASELQDLAAHYVLEPVDRLGDVYRVTGRQESNP